MKKTLLIALSPVLFLSLSACEIGGWKLSKANSSTAQVEAVSSAAELAPESFAYDAPVSSAGTDSGAVMSSQALSAAGSSAQEAPKEAAPGVTLESLSGQIAGKWKDNQGKVFEFAFTGSQGQLTLGGRVIPFQVALEGQKLTLTLPGGKKQLLRLKGSALVMQAPGQTAHTMKRMEN
jgi:hypothetical protein